MKIKTKKQIIFETEEEQKLILNCLMYVKHRIVQHEKPIANLEILEEIISEIKFSK